MVPQADRALCLVEVDNRLFFNVGQLHGRHRSGSRRGAGGAVLPFSVSSWH